MKATLAFLEKMKVLIGEYAADSGFIGDRKRKGYWEGASFGLGVAIQEISRTLTQKKMKKQIRKLHLIHSDIKNKNKKARPREITGSI